MLPDELNVLINLIYGGQIQRLLIAQIVPQILRIGWFSPLFVAHIGQPFRLIA